MIGFLRFIGVANAAVWFGAAVFYTLSAAPALASADVEALLGRNNFPSYGGALGVVLLTRYFHFHLGCAIIALLHLVMEWLYQGRAPKRIWTGLLVTLFWIGLAGSLWLAPKLRETQRAQYHTNATPAQREAAGRSFRIWEGVFQALNVILLGGVAAYLWRAANPPDDLRFVGTPKFRG